MGGMLPSWEEYPKGRIKQPLDAARYWEEVAVSHKMPLDGDVWIEDPLHSSYPPSIAFKAAQMQHHLKARSFLRKMQEMVFIEKKNIIKWDYIAQAALETGLDSARLQRDFGMRASDLFNEDLNLARTLGITTFPTLLFTVNGETHAALRGFQPYDKLEEIVRRIIPDVKKDNINTDPQHLFSLFPTLTTKEFAELTNRSMDESLEVLQELYLNAKINRYESKNGTIWKRKPRPWQ
jgi:predicted DsbA family dithiol-disulfide isomerase